MTYMGFVPNTEITSRYSFRGIDSVSQPFAVCAHYRMAVGDNAKSVFLAEAEICRAISLEFKEALGQTWVVASFAARESAERFCGIIEDEKVPRPVSLRVL